MTNSVDPDQTTPIGAVCSGSTLFASILNLSVILCTTILVHKGLKMLFMELNAEHW